MYPNITPTYKILFKLLRLRFINGGHSLFHQTYNLKFTKFRYLITVQTKTGIDTEGSYIIISHASVQLLLSLSRQHYDTKRLSCCHE